MLQDDEVVGSLLEKIHSVHDSKQLPMITIRDSLQNSKNGDVSVFPPVNHENLQIATPPARDQRKQREPPAKSPSPSSPPPDLSSSAPGSSKDVKLVVGWLDFGLEILHAKIVSVRSWLCDDTRVGGGGGSRGPFWSFGPMAGVAVRVSWWWLCWWIKRGPRVGESVERLKLIIQKKDDKISKLLHQIAQMNEVPGAPHEVLASKLAY